MKIDLRTCKRGDILISSHGLKLMYLRPTNEGEYLDHKVKYLDEHLGEGTRSHDGFVFPNFRIPKTDNDIVEIIRK